MRSLTTSRVIKPALAFRRRHLTPHSSPRGEHYRGMAQCGGLDLAVAGTRSAWRQPCGNASINVRSDPCTRTTPRFPRVASVRLLCWRTFDPVQLLFCMTVELAGVERLRL
jgi:hypothetical protein